MLLLCDSWYPKAEVAALVEQFGNLEMVCNARVDMALYGLPPAKTGKKGRPRKRGSRIQMDEIVFGEPESGDWLIGMMPVITNLWKDKLVLKRACMMRGRFCPFNVGGFLVYWMA